MLVVAIAAQFRTGTPTDRQVDTSSTASDASVPSISAPGATDSSPDVSVSAISAPDTASQGGAKDTGDPSGTDQSIQAEVTKPSAPSAEAKTNPNQTPDGKKASKTDNGTPTADSSSKSSTPKSGDKKDGKIYIPGFGWVTDNGGGGSGTTAGDMYENGNKIGNMS
ncbi:hypothetical protein CAFE_24520 [Caprobacter fermentans]|uniref:Uncharacterized protein n=1 Tax=Caproicibacter fermentans TaxID=2576756 RepID=A0A6N8I1D6_9FIRM|nr:hypothetical protein [Caproicibacter fermentans]